MASSPVPSYSARRAKIYSETVRQGDCRRSLSHRFTASLRISQGALRADLRLEEVADPLDFVDRAECRADEDLLETHIRDALDALARLTGRADEVDRGQFRQFGRFRAFLEIDRAVGEDGVGAAGLAIGLHAEF